MKELICVVCPRGCRLSVGDAPDFAVTGNGCPRGAAYGKEETLFPMRIVTATCAAIRGGDVNASGDSLSGPRRVPVKTTGGVPRARVGELVALVQKIAVRLPVREGDVIVADWEGMGVDVVATRSVE